MSCDHVEHYRRFGYAVVQGVFDSAEVQALANACDRLYAEGMRHGSSFRHQNVFYKLVDDPVLGRVLRMVQWPSYFDAVLARFRVDPRLLDIMAPLIGCNLKQIINQIHWKPPGARNVEFGFHQDIRSRRPREAYRRPEASYVQTGIAIDPHRPDNGAMTVLPGSHRLGELSLPERGAMLERQLCNDDLRALGLDPDDAVHLELEPGDVALWHLHLVHGSGPNTAGQDRRFHINGYVVADRCERGEWAFRDGEPCELGEPVLVHYEELHTHPGPYYVD